MRCPGLFCFFAPPWAEAGSLCPYCRHASQRDRPANQPVGGSHFRRAPRLGGLNVDDQAVSVPGYGMRHVAKLDFGEFASSCTAKLRYRALWPEQEEVVVVKLFHPLPRAKQALTIDYGFITILLFYQSNEP